MYNIMVVCHIIGPFVDKIRHMDDPEARSLVMPSAGIILITTCTLQLYIAGKIISLLYICIATVYKWKEECGSIIYTCY